MSRLTEQLKMDGGSGGSAFLSLIRIGFAVLVIACQVCQSGCERESKQANPVVSTRTSSSERPFVDYDGVLKKPARTGNDGQATSQPHESETSPVPPATNGNTTLNRAQDGPGLDASRLARRAVRVQTDDKLVAQGKSAIKMTAAFAGATVKALRSPPSPSQTEKFRQWFARCLKDGVRVDGPDPTLVDPGSWGVVIDLTVNRDSQIGQASARFGYNREWTICSHYETNQYAAVVMGPVAEGTILMPPKVNEQWLADGVDEVIVSVRPSDPGRIEMSLLLTCRLEPGQKWACENFAILPPIKVEPTLGTQYR